MADVQLSEGSLKAIMAGEEVSNPIMQILGTKKIPGGNTERFRVLLSDGLNINSFAMLATQLNDQIYNETLCEFTVVQLKRYIVSGVASTANNRSVLIILELDVVKKGSEVGCKLGNPQTMTADNSSTQQAQTNGHTTPAKPSSAPASNMSSTSMNGGQVTNTHPIVSLSPYQNKWTIKARVTNKTNIREWQNARGSGKLFSIDLLDESGEIRATVFSAECDKFYDMIEKGKVYYISNCTLKPANKKFSSINNDYEMTFTHSTTVIPCNEDEVGAMPDVKFNFVPLKGIAEASPDDVVDVLGICVDAQEATTVTSRSSQKTFTKREITLVDQSMASVSMTLWGQTAETFDASNKPVIAVKGVKVQEFQGGKTLSLSMSSILTQNPDIPDAHKLLGWYSSQSNTKFEPVSQRTASAGMSASGKWTLIKEIQDQQLGMGDKADYRTVRAIIQVIRGNNTTYKACPTPECNKKVIDQNNGLYRCEKCNKEFNTFKHRLILPVMIGDWTNSIWITLFQNEAEETLGVTADEIGESQEEHPALKSAVFKQFVFRLRAKVEFYNDEKRLKFTCAGIKPLDHAELSKKLIAEIKELAGLETQMHTD